MASRSEITPPAAMASPWRRRRMCVLMTDTPAPAALREVSAAGAFLETRARPALGDTIELHHPEAGAIIGRVSAIAIDGVALRFDRSPAAVAFALAAISADMSRAR